MIDEKLIIDELNRIKANSRKVFRGIVMMRQKHIEYFIDLIIQFIEDHSEDSHMTMTEKEISEIILHQTQE